jgi:NAD(P)-dependent dehydrogenase (short-subunit alcohol dehydrogenase family)
MTPYIASRVHADAHLLAGEEIMSTQVAAAQVRLDGQAVIVTGGGRGIGRSCALALASAGAHVAIAARSADQLAETSELIAHAGGRALAFTLDVTDRIAVATMVAAVEQQLGPITLLVNNAGVASPLGPIWEVDPGEWWRTQEINVWGLVLCAQAVLPGMIERGGGRIINMVSGSGLGVMTHASAYVVSKAAAIRLTECMADETAEHKHSIPVFGLGPGLVRTAMTEYLGYSDAGRKWLPWGEALMESGRDVPPERSAEMVLVLASGRADALSGRFLELTDDIDALIDRAEEIKRDDLYTMRLRT